MARHSLPLRVALLLSIGSIHKKWGESFSYYGRIALNPLFFSQHPFPLFASPRPNATRNTRRWHPAWSQINNPMQVPAQLDARTIAAARPISAISVAEAVTTWLQRIDDCGHETLLTGETVLRLALGLPCNYYSVESSITRDELLHLAPRAIPTGVMSGAWTLPTAAGPIDLKIERSRSQIIADLETRAFRITAVAYEPASDSLIGSPEAIQDLTTGDLALPPSAATTPIDPDLPLKAARLISIYGFTPSREVLDLARSLTADAVSRDRQPRMRALIRDLFGGPHVRAGLEWLRASGYEQALIVGVRDGAAALVESLPNRFPLRMFAWLIGTEPKPFLRDLRFGGEFSSTLYRLSAHHPIEQLLDPTHDPSINKLLRNLSSEERADLCAVRHAEIEDLRARGHSTQADKIAQGLYTLNLGFERIRAKKREREARAELALSGREVMEHLGCEPGPFVGSAIRFLEQCVEQNSSANTSQSLTHLLDQYAATADPKGPTVS